MRDIHNRRLRIGERITPFIAATKWSDVPKSVSNVMSGFESPRSSDRETGREDVLFLVAPFALFFSSSLDVRVQLKCGCAVADLAPGEYRYRAN